MWIFPFLATPLIFFCWIDPVRCSVLCWGIVLTDVNRCTNGCRTEALMRRFLSLETGFDRRVNLSKFWVLWAFMDIKVPQSKGMKPFSASPALGRFSFFWLFLWKRHSVPAETWGHCTMLSFYCCNIPLGLKGLVKSVGNFLSFSVCWEHVLAASKTPSNTVYKTKREGHFWSLTV